MDCARIGLARSNTVVCRHYFIVYGKLFNFVYFVNSPREMEAVF